MPTAPGLQRKAINLCVRQGLSLRAAAARLGVSHQTVKNILDRHGYTRPRKWEAK